MGTEFSLIGAGGADPSSSCARHWLMARGGSRMRGSPFLHAIAAMLAVIAEAESRGPARVTNAETRATGAHRTMDTIHDRLERGAAQP